MNSSRPRKLLLGLLSASAALLLLVAAAAAQTIVHVSDAQSLQNAANSAMPGTVIVVAPGIYDLTRELRFGASYVTLRGETGAAEDVVLVGPGMNTYVEGLAEGIVVNNDYVTIRDLTIEEWYWHGIHIRGEYGVSHTTIVNVRTRNIGERHVKGSNSDASGKISENVLIERLYMEQTKQRQGSGDDNYVGGIDAMGISNWTVRDCVAVGIQGRYGGGRGAIFLWNGAENCTVERNVFVDCDRAICFGNPYNPNQWHHTDGGIIRNNFISNSNGDSLELCYNKDLKVYNNTIYAGDGSPYWEAIFLYDRSFAPLTNVQLANNIVRGQILDSSGGGWTSSGDLIGGTAQADWFVDVPGGDLHLTALAAGAIDAAVPLGEVQTDFDGVPRQVLPDVGADERVSYCPGDADVNGVVDGADYTRWADHYGQPGLWLDGRFNYERLWAEGDFNCDRVVDGADYTLWADQYGVPCGDSAVPEPGMLSLLAAGAFGCLRRGRKRAAHAFDWKGESLYEPGA